jgi:WD40 repeat protein
MTVWIWDATTGHNAQPYRKHTGSITHLSWSPNGQRFVSASADGTAMVWDVSNLANPLFTYQGHVHTDGFSSVLSAAWSPDGKYIASGGSDGTVQIWDHPMVICLIALPS